MSDMNNTMPAEPVDAQQLHIMNRALSVENSSLKAQIDVLRRSSNELETLRRILESVSIRKHEIESELQHIQSELQKTSSEQQSLRSRLAELEAEAARYSSMYVDAEQQNTNLTSLYVASHHLHASVDRGDVLARIQEIVINLIGSEELAIFELESNGSTLELAQAFGIDEEVYRRLPLSAGLIGRVAATGVSYIAADGPEAPVAATDAELTACIPLKLGERVTGAIAIFKLLPQKDAIGALDRDLFDLLSNHASVALYTSTLHRKAAAGLM